MSAQMLGQNQDIPVDNTFALAVAVLQDRISRLPQPDRDDLMELMPDLLSGTPEDQAAARVAVAEILHQKPVKIVPCPLPEPADTELDGWLKFVSSRIREEREKAGLTQVQLAAKAGIPQPHLSKLENGVHSPTSMTLEKIANALGVPLSTLDPSS